MNPYARYFYTPDDLPLMDLDQIYMTSSAYLATGFKDVWATFDLLVRDMPGKRNFMVFTGLEEIIRGIMGWHYTDAHVKLLRQYKLISLEFSRYLKKFKFSGTVYAMREGSIFFPGEPVVRVTAPIIEGNLITAFLMTALSSNVPFSTKYARAILTAAPRGYKVAGASPNRALSFESAFKVQRACYIAGSVSVPSPLVRTKLGVPNMKLFNNTYHAFIKSYPTELEAMRVAARQVRVKITFMVDTYDLKSGLKNAIIVAKEMQACGQDLPNICIDSGDYLETCRYVRRELDKAGLKEVQIVLAGNFDEYKIDKLAKARVPANSFIVATEAQTCSDSSPKLEAVYKMAELIRDGKSEHKMKLSVGKVSLPGRKQVFRVFKNEKYHHDIIGLEGEKLGMPLLRLMIKNGKQVYKLPSVTEIRDLVAQELKKLPPKLKDIWHERAYPVKTSAKLQKLADDVRAHHLGQYQF